MVFVFGVDTKGRAKTEACRKAPLEGSVEIKSEISVTLATQGICDVLGGGWRNELRA